MQHEYLFAKYFIYIYFYLNKAERIKQNKCFLIEIIFLTAVNCAKQNFQKV